MQIWLKRKQIFISSHLCINIQKVELTLISLCYLEFLKDEIL